jgi:hypothetical protein
MGRYLPLAISIIAIAISFTVSVVICRGPVPVSDEAPKDQFSSERALDYLKQLLGDQTPHPSNSIENHLVRQRLISQLETFGLAVELQTGYDRRLEHNLHNVLARFPGGDESLNPLLVVTHYDSVASGPGAGDAGSCVCSLLETIRAMKHRPIPERPVYFLFTDGEERGMRGASLFVNQHPLAKQNPFVLNFDARGSSGPSLTFETHTGNLDIIADLNQALPFPKLTGSSFVSVYRLLPNATDFHVFYEADFKGVNSAFMCSPHNYHTPNDTIENLSLRTLQHHGEKVLSLTSYYAKADHVRNDETGDAVFFDLFGLFLIWWPAWWSIPICFVALTSHLAALTYRRRKAGRPIDWYPFKQLLATVVFSLIIVALFGLFVPLILRAAGILDARFTKYDPWITASFWLAVWSVVVLIIGRTCRDLSDQSIWNVVWTIAMSLNAILAIVLPGFTFYLVFASVLVAILSWTSISKRWASIATTAVYSITICTTVYLIAIAFGPGKGFILCPVFVLLLFPIFPQFGRPNQVIFAK